MSVNCCRTKCEHCVWDFAGASYAGDDLRLMTIEQYMAAVGSKRSKDNGGYGWGHGFRQREDYTWTRYRSKGDPINGYCGGSFSGEPSPSRLRELEAQGFEVTCERVKFIRVAEAEMYRWVKAHCPLCGALYALWLSHDAIEVGKPVTYSPYDMSYYWAFNDEPSKQDMEVCEPLSGEDLIEAVKVWRHAKQRLEAITA